MLIWNLNYREQDKGVVMEDSFNNNYYYKNLFDDLFYNIVCKFDYFYI